MIDAILFTIGIGSVCVLSFCAGIGLGLNLSDKIEE